jgi:hypothetical protein
MNQVWNIYQLIKSKESSKNKKKSFLIQYPENMNLWVIDIYREAEKDMVEEFRIREVWKKREEKIEKE